MTRSALPHSRAYKRYVVWLLLMVYIVNQTDRNVFGFLMEPVKRDLRLTDTQLGFVAGPALVLLYSLLGIPIARWGDRSNRVNIMSAAIGAWSCATALFAAVGSFWQLSLAQVGVGIGEAGFSAIAMSVIGDYHPDAAARGRALSVFMLAIPLSGIASSLVAGWINETYGWRAVFITAGLVGLPLMGLMLGTVREPTRRNVCALVSNTDRPPLRAIFTVLWRRRALRHLALGQCLANVLVNAALWLPPFFVREYGMTTGALGNWFAVIYGVGGSIGVWLSGYLPGRHGSQNEFIEARLTAVATALICPVLLVVLWCPNKTVDLTILIPCQALLCFYLTPNMAMVQTLAPANMRAAMASVFILLQMLAGGVIGTQLVGISSDAIAPILGSSASALRWSITLFSLVGVWAAAHFWWAGYFAREEVAAGPGTEVRRVRERGDSSVSSGGCHICGDSET
jgi:MFS family permease